MLMMRPLLINKANQTANTPEESGKQPRNETPKRHIIARINVKKLSTNYNYQILPMILHL